MIFDLVKKQYERDIEAAEERLARDAEHAIRHLIDQIDCIDTVSIGMGTWIFEGPDVEVGYEDTYGYHTPQEIVDWLMEAEDRRTPWEPRIPEKQLSLMRQLEEFIQWLPDCVSLIIRPKQEQPV